MASTIGWLDYSEAESRQVRELMRALDEPSTVDDLGIGTIRDAISNRLFPGTSVIQSRARYFLFVPWIFRKAERDHHTRAVAKAEDMERSLVSALQQAPDNAGMIGRFAGRNVKTLPSAIYWTGLAAYRIFLQPGMGRAQYDRSVRRGAFPSIDEDELSDRRPGYWHSELPDHPEDFFLFDQADFVLRRDEAEWLAERVLSTEPLRGPNLLGSLVRRAWSAPPLSESLWAQPLPKDTSGEVRDLVLHAERFSLANEAASLVYNLALARLRNDPERDDELSTWMEDLLEEWAERAQAADLAGWAADTSAFWTAIGGRANFRAAPQRFVDRWAALLSTHPLDGLAQDDDAVTLVRRREIEHKRPQLARFTNASRRDRWDSPAGIDPLDFRWRQVRRFLDDLSTGLRTADAGIGDAAH